MLLFDEYQRLGHNILAAQEQLAPWGHKRTEEQEKRSVREQNAQSMAQLQMMMAGVKKRPRV